jgi:cytochrome o ubiquinol oxidase subunit 2
MNQFFVPQLGSMVATMNGMVTQLWLQADRVGTYYGESTQFSGDGFSGMHFMLNAVPAQQFALWLDEVRSDGPTLDRRGYRTLSMQSRDVPPVTYAAVDAGLFQAVVKHELPPGPGPQQGNAAAPSEHD